MRTIYLNPGEQVRVRFVPEGHDKNASEWDFGHRREMLVQLYPNHIKFVDPAIFVTRKDLFGDGEMPYNPTPKEK